MPTEFRASDWAQYKMTYGNPHRELEPLEKEEEIVDQALEALRKAGMLPHTQYDHAKFLAHREAVAQKFEIPWTAISPRVQRLLYAINAIAHPTNMIAAGVFCGNTFVSNAGAAVGPGACYEAKNLIGVEIIPEEAERAERNVRLLDATGIARVVAADAQDVVAEFEEPIHLLYLDADGSGKKVYENILRKAYDRMPKGALVLAHNSVNASERLASYLEYVRDPNAFQASLNVILDPEGLEVTVR